MLLNFPINYYLIKEVIYVKISTRKQTETETQECRICQHCQLVITQKLDCFHSKLRHTVCHFLAHAYQKKQMRIQPNLIQSF